MRRTGRYIDMTRFRIDFRGPAFRSVLGYTFSHWRSQPLRLSAMIIGMLLATAADVLTPLYSGRLARECLCRLDGAQGDTRHVGA
ncbi:hypothetical protein P041_01139, partial [Brucella sp. 04-5288]